MNPSAGTELLLSCHLAEGSWCLRTYDRQTAVAGGAPKARDLPLAGTPDASFVLGCPEKDPLVVAGRLGDSGTATAWAFSGDWRRIHLSPAPSALTSVAYAWGGRHTWIGGVADGRAAVYELLPLPFRGPLRSFTLPMPHLELVHIPDGGGRPLVLVDDTTGDEHIAIAEQYLTTGRGQFGFEQSMIAKARLAERRNDPSGALQILGDTSGKERRPPVPPPFARAQ